MGTGRGERKIFALLGFFKRQLGEKEEIYQILMIKISIFLNVLFLYHEYLGLSAVTFLKRKCTRKFVSKLSGCLL